MISTPIDTQAAAHIESVLHREIPASKALELHVVSLASGRIRLEAPIGCTNVNIHGTAFAGSLYSISALAAWGMMYHTLQCADMKAALVIAEANIKYLRPVMGEIIAEANFTESDREAFISDLTNKGKAVSVIEVQISDGTGQKATNVVKLYAAISDN